MTTRVGVITFPGSLDDRDALHAIEVAGGEPVPLWHADADLKGVDAVILPGGFSYGDYLRCGAVAHLAAIMDPLRAFAADGGPVLGICNGFQILCEAGLLPGALLRNANLRFVCRRGALTVEARSSIWTRGVEVGTVLELPVKHGEGRYHADPRTLDELESEGRVLLRYRDASPNGSARAIAGVCNADGNVAGLMPHPEHAVDPDLPMGTDGLAIIGAVVSARV